MTIEKRLKCAAKDIGFALEFPAALPADIRNALSLARTTVDAAWRKLAEAREGVQQGGAARVEGDPKF